VDFQKFDEMTQEDSTENADVKSRRGAIALLAGALIAAGFVGVQSAEARNRGGKNKNNGRGGKNNGRGGRGGRGNGGRGNGRGGRH
jgi:hypothetical protein